MSERRIVGARLLFFVLLVANVAFFAYWRFNPDARSAAAARIEHLQINPTRIKLMGSASRGPGGQTPKAACLEWGPFPAASAGAAEAALAKAGLRTPPVQRTVGEADGVRRIAYFMREPDAAAVKRIAELQRGFPDTAISAVPCPS